MRPLAVELAAAVHTALLRFGDADVACGAEPVALLGGHHTARRAVVSAWHPLPNVAVAASAPHSFVVDPIAFARAEAELRSRGTDWLGFVHGHPGGVASLSQRDRQQAWRDCVQLVVGRRDIAAFWLHGERCEPLPLVVRQEAGVADA